jgi:dipeptidase E
MITFLTSSPFREDTDRPSFSNLNGFVDRLRGCLPPNPRCLFICSSPDRPDLTCLFGADLFMAFANSGIHFRSYEVLDNRNAHQAPQLVSGSNLIVLAGGHVPTQNAFFQRIGLRQLLQNYTGVVMGISAGSMNSADVVYSQPEKSGESSADYQRFFPGLGLTHVQILPHYQQERDAWLDGKRLYEDITYADSFGHEFIAIPDGSYVLVEDGCARLFGEGYRITQGRIERICGEEESIEL